MDIEIKAGPKLDAAVANALGNEFVLESTDGVCLVWEGDVTDPSLYKEFCPSTDLNDAFEAADQCGLFVDEFACLRIDACPLYEWWQVSREIDTDYGIEEEMLADYCKTPALAICEAILALSYPNSEGWMDEQADVRDGILPDGKFVRLPKHFPKRTRRFIPTTSPSIL